MDFVFTVCDLAANEDCPTWPGAPISAHWGIPDPSKLSREIAVPLHAFEQTYDLLHNRISAFVTRMQDTRDPISLQHHIDSLAQDYETQ